MVNVLIPAMGKSLFFKDSYFPKPMIEVAGETMLEKVVHNYEKLRDNYFIFIFDKNDCSKFHLDESARILTEPQTEIIVLENQTAGALCTSLLAIDKIDNDNPLIVANCDQIIDVDYNEVLAYFEKRKASAGVITFESIHPRWSYARIKDNEVIEVAEKRPLSQNAIAGLYYYRHGHDFVEAAKKVILKENNIDEKYYISSTMNEIILQGGKIVSFEVNKKQYHSFYSPEKVKEYEGYFRGTYEDRKN